MTALADLRLAAQQRCDRVNSATPSTSEWNSYINGSAAALYRILGQTYEDYNVQQYSFTLVGNAGGNILQIGPGTPVPAYDKLRHLARVVQNAGASNAPVYAPVIRCDSLMRFDELSAPVLGTYYGAFIAVQYMVLGNTIEIRPAASSAASYLLYYIPAFQKLVNDTDTIDGTWMATNGIDEYIVLDAAAKAMVKEESLDTAALLMQEREAVKTQILAQFAQRDDNMPGRIVDAKRARANMGLYGWGGFGGL
jgi:hypothetical protein